MGTIFTLLLTGLIGLMLYKLDFKFWIIFLVYVIGNLFLNHDEITEFVSYDEILFVVIVIIHSILGIIISYAAWVVKRDEVLEEYRSFMSKLDLKEGGAVNSEKIRLFVSNYTIPTHKKNGELYTLVDGLHDITPKPNYDYIFMWFVMWFIFWSYEALEVLVKSFKRVKFNPYENSYRKKIKEFKKENGLI